MAKPWLVTNAPSFVRCNLTPMAAIFWSRIQTPVYGSFRVAATPKSFSARMITFPNPANNDARHTYCGESAKWDTRPVVPVRRYVTSSPVHLNELDAWLIPFLFRHQHVFGVAAPPRVMT